MNKMHILFKAIFKTDSRIASFLTFWRMEGLLKALYSFYIVPNTKHKHRFFNPINN